jgi:hypothetical protein
MLQLQQHGYVPPPLPGGECYADSAVMLPGADVLAGQFAAQLTAVQALLSQLQSTAASGADQLELQPQLEALGTQAAALNAAAVAHAASADASLRAGASALQDSLDTATGAVSSFIDAHAAQLDLPAAKLEMVVDTLRSQVRCGTPRVVLRAVHSDACATVFALLAVAVTSCHATCRATGLFCALCTREPGPRSASPHSCCPPATFVGFVSVGIVVYV